MPAINGRKCAFRNYLTLDNRKLLLLFVVVTAVILINYEFGVVADFIPDVIEISLTEDDLRDYMSVVILEMVKRLFFTSQLNVFY